MGYLHIDNLYKNKDILLLKECYALEKIHGTSAHIRWADERVTFFSGGADHLAFSSLFDVEALTAKFKEHHAPEVIVYGEAYGGKMQAMSDTYGKDLKFVAFDVKKGQYHWLNVPEAAGFCKWLGLEFVDYARIPADVQIIELGKLAPSTQAKRNGCGDLKIREGVVLRPLVELRTPDGERIISKHKHDKFGETKTKRPITDEEELKLLVEANAIAEEWVTPMRLVHVLDKLCAEHKPQVVSIEWVPEVIRAMLADIEREAKGEIIQSKAARKAISRRAALLFKQELMQITRAA